MYGLMLCLMDFTICVALKIFVLRENENKREHEQKKERESVGGGSYWQWYTQYLWIASLLFSQYSSRF